MKDPQDIEIEDWAEIIPSFLRIPYKLYTNRKLFIRLYKKFQASVLGSKSDIIILGRSAVGKSVLGAQLFQEVNLIGWDLPELSKNVESGVVNINNWPKVIRVIPGQHVSERRVAMQNHFGTNGNQLDGVIYVADYGFTEERNEKVKLKMIQSGITDISKLSKHGREIEAKDFGEVVTRIIECPIEIRPKWLLVAITKADLFYNKIRDVKHYYMVNSKSPFVQEMERLRAHLGDESISIDYAPVCSIARTMEWNGTKAKSRISGTQEQQALLTHFMVKMAKLNGSI